MFLLSARNSERRVRRGESQTQKIARAQCEKQERSEYLFGIFFHTHMVFVWCWSKSDTAWRFCIKSVLQGWVSHTRAQVVFARQSNAMITTNSVDVSWCVVRQHSQGGCTWFARDDIWSSCSAGIFLFVWAMKGKSQCYPGDISPYVVLDERLVLHIGGQTATPPLDPAKTWRSRKHADMLSDY